MPEPFSFYGQDYMWGSPELRDAFRKDIGPDAFQELINYKTGKSTIGPIAGKDYLLGGQRSDSDRKEVQKYYDRLYDSWREQGWNDPSPPPKQQGNVLEEDVLLKALMEQRR